MLKGGWTRPAPMYIPSYTDYRENGPGLRLCISHHILTIGRMDQACAYVYSIILTIGRMDQACAYGCVPVLMTFDADILRIKTIPLKGQSAIAI